MAIIYTYPEITVVTGDELLICSDVLENNITKSMSAAAFGLYIHTTYGPGIDIYSVDGALSGNRTLSGGGNSLTFSGLSLFTVASPVELGSTFKLTTGASLNHVLTSDASGNATWAAPTTGTVTSVTGTPPITSTGGATPAIGLDIKANSGIVIDTNQLSLDVGASAITGILSVGDGGTGDSLTMVAGDVYYAASATQFGVLGAGASGDVLTAQGAGIAPAWATPASSGDGIYDGSGSLSGATVVTQDLNELSFNSSGVGSGQQETIKIENTITGSDVNIGLASSMPSNIATQEVIGLAGVVGTYNLFIPLANSDVGVYGAARNGTSNTSPTGVYGHCAHQTSTYQYGVRGQVTGNNTASGQSYAGWFGNTSTKNGAGAVNYGLHANSWGSGGLLNIAGYFSALNGVDNYAIVVPPSHGDIGFGTSTPTATVQIGEVGNVATFKFVDGNQAAGYVLTSDINGVGTWTSASVNTNIYTHDGTTGAGRTVTLTDTLQFIGGQVDVTAGTTDTGATVLSSEKADTTNIVEFNDRAQGRVNSSAYVASAQFEVASDTRGFLPPRNADPVTNIPGPVEGLMAWDSTDNELQVFDSANWITLGDLNNPKRTWNWGAARNSSSVTNQYIRTFNGTPNNLCPYVIPFNCILTDITCSTLAVETWDAQVHVNGVSVAQVAVVAAQTGTNIGLSVAISAGDQVAFYCNGTAVGYPHIQAWFKET